MELQMGANAPVLQDRISIRIVLPPGADIDVTALQTYADGKVRGDDDMCFFNQPSIAGGAVVLSRNTPGQAGIAVDFAKVPDDAEKIVLTATIDGNTTFGSLSGVVTIAVADVTMTIPTAGRSEKALILAEVYRRNGQWKVRNVAQGFNGGLAALAKHFGVDIAEPAPAPAPAPAAAPPRPAPAPQPAPPQPAPPPAAPPVNLTKVTLTKADSRISLKKADGRFGKIRINLNWNQKKKKSGLFGLGSTSVDLDVGAFIEDMHGNITAVQALGNAFGDYNRFPFVKLMGDDRTGAVTDGEWIEINGDNWSSLRRVLLYAFIYEGVPNWAETDGVVRVFVPNQPEIEVRMNEYGSQQGMCAIALLENVGGEIRVSREVTFHGGHKVMDDAYGWGLQWRAGRK